MAGCGNHDVTVAPECTESVGTMMRALAAAPGEVRVGSTLVSSCFKGAAGSADVQSLGSIVIEATHRLADRTRAAPRSRAAVELGFLVGAVRRGTGSSGVHYETGRRVEQELIGVPTATPEFRRGLAAGLQHG